MFISVPPRHKFRDAHSRLFAGVRTHRAAPCNHRRWNLFGVCPEIHFADKTTHVAKELDYLIAFHALKSSRSPRGVRSCVKLG